MMLQGNLVSHNEVHLKGTLSPSLYRNRLVNGSSFKTPSSAAKQSQLLVRIKASVPNPTAQEIVLARQPATGDSFVNVRIGAKYPLNNLHRRRVHALIRIQTQNPISHRFVDGRIFLRGVAFPLLDENFRAVGLDDLHCAVGRTGIDDYHFSFAVGNERPHAFEGATDVGFFVVGDYDDR